MMEPASFRGEGAGDVLLYRVGRNTSNPSGVGVNVVTSFWSRSTCGTSNIRAGKCTKSGKEKEVLAEEYLLDDAEYVIVAYVAPPPGPSPTAIGELRGKGIRAA